YQEVRDPFVPMIRAAPRNLYFIHRQKNCYQLLADFAQGLVLDRADVLVDGREAGPCELICELRNGGVLDSAVSQSATVALPRDGLIYEVTRNRKAVVRAGPCAEYENVVRHSNYQTP